MCAALPELLVAVRDEHVERLALDRDARAASSPRRLQRAAEVVLRGRDDRRHAELLAAERAPRAASAPRLERTRRSRGTRSRRARAARTRSGGQRRRGLERLGRGVLGSRGYAPTSPVNISARRCAAVWWMRASSARDRAHRRPSARRARAAPARARSSRARTAANTARGHRARVVGDRGDVRLRRRVAHRAADLDAARAVILDLASIASAAFVSAATNQRARRRGREVPSSTRAQPRRGRRVLALPAVRLGLIEQQAAEDLALRTARDAARRARRRVAVVARDERLLRRALIRGGRARDLAAALEVLRERDRARLLRVREPRPSGAGGRACDPRRSASRTRPRGRARGGIDIRARPGTWARVRARSARGRTARRAIASRSPRAPRRAAPRRRRARTAARTRSPRAARGAHRPPAGRGDPARPLARSRASCRCLPSATARISSSR